jgi:modification target Cys-rich repeat protein
MRKKAIGVLSMIAPAVLGAVTAGGCDKVADAADTLGGAFEEVCGPCGLVSQGDIGISGNAKVDGFFSAVSSLNDSFVQINGSFEARIDNLIAAFGVEVAANASLSAKVDALKAEINAQITANASGGVAINYVPARCEANVNVAVDAQAKCEVKGGCQAMVDPGEVSVTCEGTCSGSCEGTCTGGFECDVSAGAECSGECSGSCELDAAAACNGTCRGTCSGTCSAQDSMGNCAGQCDGMCEGTCELSAAAECQGTCHGSCKVEAQADCEGEAPKCSGSCMGECKGSCTGKATPPSVAANCDASADCKAQASAQASAKLVCTPPTLDIGYQFNADLDASAQASFSAKMAALKLEGVAIVQGFANLTALIDGKVDGVVVINPPPLVQIRTSVQGLISAGANGDLVADMPAGRITCALAGFSDAVSILGTVGTTAATSISTQGSFVTSLTTGDF